MVRGQSQQNPPCRADRQLTGDLAPWIWRAPAGAAAARAAAQAAAVAHLAAHALGAAGYAAKAVSLAPGNGPDQVAAELSWQLDQLTGDQRRALARLPLLGEERTGPLGPGLLAQGIVGATIRHLQAAVRADPARPGR